MSAVDRILVIDDDVVLGEIISASAQAMGLHCVVTREPSTFFNLITPDTSLILLDLIMPDMDGIEVLRVLGELQCKARIVLMSGVDKRVIETAEKLAHSLGLSVVGLLQKPFPLADLKAILGALAVPETPEPATKTLLITISDEELIRAFERREFINYFQPQISLATGKVTGVEALARWQHPQLGLILPEHFIARIDSLGLMDNLCWLTAELAMDEARQFAESDGTLPRLSLNVSVQSLRNLEFPDKFMRLASQYEFPAERIAIEITESGLIHELSRTLDVLTRLRMRNIQLSIDDFGIGYAMMRQLQNVPATEIKIDRSFVQNMHAKDSDRVMVQKIIEMGHALNMQVIAEGVITQAQVDMLRQWGCDGAQGYLFSRPLSTAKMVHWLADRRASKSN